METQSHQYQIETPAGWIVNESFCIALEETIGVVKNRGIIINKCVQSW